MLIAVILGLSLTHLLRGLSKLIHMRRTIKPYWVQIVWTVNILVYVLAVWWGMFWWNKLESWSIEEFFAIAAYCSVLFMLSSMLYPPEFPNDLDFKDYFFTNKSWFFGILILATLLDVPETATQNLINPEAAGRSGPQRVERVSSPAIFILGAAAGQLRPVEESRQFSN